jgi:hypothetical protein
MVFLKRYIPLVLSILLITFPCYAGTTTTLPFSNSFNCGSADWTHYVGSWPSGSYVTPDNCYIADPFQYVCSDTFSYDGTGCDGVWNATRLTVKGSQILSSANHVGGEGGDGANDRAFRLWIGHNAEVDYADGCVTPGTSGGPTNQSGGMNIHLASSSYTNEIWIRVYQKYQTGFGWIGSGLFSEKIMWLYGNAAGSPGNVLMLTNMGPGYDGLQLSSTEHGSRNWCVTTGNGPVGHPTTWEPTATGCGWQTMWNSDCISAGVPHAYCTGLRLGTNVVSDGSWHSTEYHIKLESPYCSQNGVFQYWLDGILVADSHDMQYVKAAYCSLDSRIRMIVLGQNGALFNSTQPACLAHDFDDLKIVDPTYPTFVQDASGNQMIGPIGWGAGSPPYISSPSPTNNASYPASTNPVTMTLTTNVNANCKYNTSDVAYAAMSGTFSTGQGTTSHSQAITTTDGTVYTYYVRCDLTTPGTPDLTSTTLSWHVLNSPPAPVLTLVSPTTYQVYPLGTSSVTMSLTSDVNANCKYDTTDTTYALMANTFSTGQTTTSHSQAISTANGTSYTRYVRCDVTAGGTPDLTSFVLNWSIAATSSGSLGIGAGSSIPLGSGAGHGSIVVGP